MKQNPRASLMRDIVSDHLEKLERYYALLESVMPPYFFKSFNERELQDILTLTLDIEQKSGVQSIERPDEIIFVYLRDEKNNTIETSRRMAGIRICRSTTHESKPLPGSGEILVVEHIIKDHAQEAIKPLFTLKTMRRAYEKAFKKVPAAFDDLYERLNWRELRDLDVERLVARMQAALTVQGHNYAITQIEQVDRNEYRVTVSLPTVDRKEGFYGRCIEALRGMHYEVSRTYLREFSRCGSPEDFTRLAVRSNTFYIKPQNAAAATQKAFDHLVRALNELCLNPEVDLFDRELLPKPDFTFSSVNLLRAAAAFIHAQLAYVDAHAYTPDAIASFMAAHPAILKNCVHKFEEAFNPDAPAETMPSFKSVERLIDAVNSGIAEKDRRAKIVLHALVNFFSSVTKSNYFSEHKSALAFRLTPAFMDYYALVDEKYNQAFPPQRPYGVFFFYHGHIHGFQIRFDRIARGGWRTVMPRPGATLLETGDNFESARNQLYGECYTLAHTQHCKNKDIYEGGSKLVTLLHLSGTDDVKTQLWAAQRAVFDAFLSLINYDGKGLLRDKRIVDRTGEEEIIEIGPDENMFDTMISYMGDTAAREKYTLGAGIISGKPGTGINHKEYGVTSFGVHRYLLRTLQYLNLDPAQDAFSIKISGGPYGDVAGNELKLLNARDKKGHYIYPNVKIVAITDGPAAAYDPEGLDREELSRLIHQHNLDAFDPEKLRGENAYIVYNKPEMGPNGARYRQLKIVHGALKEHHLSTDDFQRLFQNNIYCDADVFMPCGGRPSTLNMTNYMNFASAQHLSARAIVEGANSFITPDARVALQKLGIVIVKDASANKCGVMTSSYEIMAGLMLTQAEFQQHKEELVAQVKEKLQAAADREANWLFNRFEHNGGLMTALSDELASQINAYNAEINVYLGDHPELISDELILKHLPPLFTLKFADRLRKLPYAYRRAIASVELAARITYAQRTSLKEQIQSVL